MTRVLKIIALIGALMIALGTVLALTGALFGGSRYLFSTTNGLIPDNDRQEALEPFSTISVEGKLLNVDLRPSGDNSYSIQLLYSNGLPAPSYKVNNGVLTVISDWPYRNNMNIGKRYYDAIIYYPQGTVFDAVSVDLSVCELQLDQLETKQLTVDINVADVDITRSTLGKLALDGNTVDINIDNTTAEQALFDVSIGDLDGEAFDTKEMTVNINVGDVNMCGSMEGTTRLSANMGDISIMPTLSPDQYCVYIKKSGSERNRGTPETAVNNIYATVNVGDIDLDYAD